MTLAHTQHALANWLATGADEVSALVEEGGRRGLAVYAHAYDATLVATLRDTFDKTHAWLGDEGFDAAARTHIAARPPSSWTLADYGIGFPETLARLYPDDPEIPELAQLDWSLRRAFDGPDAASLDPALLAEVDWNIAILDPVPTATLSPATTNAAAIWSAIAGGAQPPAARRLDAATHLLVWRDGLNPRFRAVDAIEARALHGILARDSFAVICDAIAASETTGAAVERAGVMLGRWLEDGLIERVRG